MGKWQASLRLVTTMDFVLYSLNGLLMVIGQRHSPSGCGATTRSASAPLPSSPASCCASSACRAGSCGWSPASSRTWAWCRRAWRPSAAPTRCVDRPDSKPLVVSRGDIRFEHVSFHYGQRVGAGTARPGGVIHDFSLHIGPGEKVGLVGRSGAGKSTLVNLLLRFYDLESGRILIDGQDIAARHAGQPAGADRHGDAGHLAAAPLGARQHPLRAPGRRRGGGHGGRQEGAGRRLHRRRSRTCAAARATTRTSASAA